MRDIDRAKAEMLGAGSMLVFEVEFMKETGHFQKLPEHIQDSLNKQVEKFKTAERIHDGEIQKILSHY